MMSIREDTEPLSADSDRAEEGTRGRERRSARNEHEGAGKYGGAGGRVETRSAPISLTGFPGRGSLRTGAKIVGQPIRAGMKFPPRSKRMLPPRGGTSGRGGRRRGNGRQKSDPRAKLFVKGLDLTAG